MICNFFNKLAVLFPSFATVINLLLYGMCKCAENLFHDKKSERRPLNDNTDSNSKDTKYLNRYLTGSTSYLLNFSKKKLDRFQVKCVDYKRAELGYLFRSWFNS